MLVGYASNYLRVAFRVPEHVAPEDVIGEVVRVRVEQSDAVVQTGSFTAQVTVPERVEFADDDGISGRMTS
jgi:threonylcarbamoyladenosine tRNA methylthiotransferase MtaB